ncbi:hypothetical protein PRJBM_00119 [Bartonella henselae]|uniref:Uncharacterized protein n=1 Tax=Bartonella henselae TaxID=38323 RepID=X5ME94_BARHN|nr:hypothetical protein Q654_00611 [Bartonella henselae JK 50]ETS09371.1 hypothetical protein Q655_00559 [Bartonella henselae JK 51]ETS09739.1 hypothetical protein Q653_00813 [Bartonella henselae JK 42]ETS12767.1 hypothetical protein Q652_00943 [Bartonella henselae JK 41]KEC58522.1 hypothetical protein O97_00420 [Bartonella henselae str. Zeus]KEC61091.1 hypothetical protein O95_00042 [Bartonella henselae JK 53]CDO39517.1 hypothetical protein PRJBM_00119 [Bartonella henselae]
MIILFGVGRFAFAKLILAVWRDKVFVFIGMKDGG